MMKLFSLMSWLAVLVLSVSVASAQEKPEMPKPTKEHAWLEQLTGEWETSSEMVMEPGKPPVKMTGTESSKMLSGFWLLTEGKCVCDGMTVNSRLTLGYDPLKKKYVGTWIDTCTGYLWVYEGSVDESGKKLVLNTEGPDMAQPGKLAKYQEVIELKGKNEKTFSSSTQDPEGKWVTFMTVYGKRK